MNTLLMRSVVAAWALVGTALGPVRADETDDKIQAWLRAHCGELSQVLKVKENPLGTKLVADGVMTEDDVRNNSFKVSSWGVVAGQMVKTCPVTPIILNPRTARATFEDQPQVVRAVQPALSGVNVAGSEVFVRPFTANVKRLPEAHRPRTKSLEVVRAGVVKSVPKMERKESPLDWRDVILRSGN